MNKKVLLTTTALFSLLAGKAFADGMPSSHHEKGLQVKWGGTVEAQAGFSAQGKKYKKVLNMSPNHKYVGLDTEAFIYLEAHAKTNSGMCYGAHVGVSPNIKFKTNSAQHYPDKTYIFVEDHGLGRFEVGSNEGAGDMFTVTAGSIAAATGGVNGDWWKYVQTSATTTPGDFILNPALPLDNDISVDTSHNPAFSNREKSRKITYLSPKFEGFQAGISYIPDVNNTGVFAALPSTDTATNQEHDAVSGGVMWDGDYNKDHKFKVALTGEYGAVRHVANTTKVRKTTALNLGGMWKFQEFLGAASFGWLGKTDQFSGTKMKNSWFATLGVGMEWDKLLGTLTGMYSERNRNKAWLVSAGLDYTLAPGFLPFAEVTYANLKGKNEGGFNRTFANATKDAGTTSVTKYKDDPKNSGKSTGLAFILGTKVKF